MTSHLSFSTTAIAFRASRARAPPIPRGPLPVDARARAPKRRWYRRRRPRAPLAQRRAVNRLRHPPRRGRRRPDPDDDPGDGDVVDVGEVASAAEPSPGPGEDDEGNKLKWMEILEESAEYDPEIQSLLDGAESNPDTVEQRIRERFETKKERIYQEREGSTVPMLVKFGEFKSQNLWIWIEAHNKIEEQEQPLLEEVFKAWFVLGKLGGFNSENMQVQANFFEVSNMEYDMEEANGESDVPTRVFHAMGGPEYNGKYCRAWFDLGSADEMCVDVLINSLITFSRDYFGIKTMWVGGENVVADWPGGERVLRRRLRGDGRHDGDRALPPAAAGDHRAGRDEQIGATRVSRFPARAMGRSHAEVR